MIGKIFFFFFFLSNSLLNGELCGSSFYCVTLFKSVCLDKCACIGPCVDLMTLELTIQHSVLRSESITFISMTPHNPTLTCGCLNPLFASCLCLLELLHCCFTLTNWNFSIGSVRLLDHFFFFCFLVGHRTKNQSARSDKTKFKPSDGRQPTWQFPLATSQWWQQCQKGGSAERTTAQHRPLHASGGATAIPLPAGPQSVTEAWAAPSSILYAVGGRSRNSTLLRCTRSRPRQRTARGRSTAVGGKRNCNRYVFKGTA